MKRVYLSLGSNLGGRQQHLERAIEAIRAAGITVLRVSPLYQTEPVGVTSQPWFLNAVVEAETDLMPRQLLKRLQKIEWDMGRRRGGASKGPRTIDIDVLLFGAHTIESPNLTVPHPRMAERRFVLEPLRDLGPGLRHPGTRRTVTEMLAATTDRSAVRRLD